MLFFGWVALVVGQFNNPTAMSQWISDAYAKKEAIAHKIDGKKIIIVAGSNALFGVDSKILEDAFGLPVVNYGVNAGIELPYTLHAAKRVINKGDVVLMPLEYPMYSYDGTAGVQMIDYIFSRDGAFFWELTLYEQFYMLWHVDFQRVSRGYFYDGGKPVTEGLYGAHHIDERGDQIESDVAHRSEWMWNEITNNYAHKPEKYGEEFDGDALGWKYLASFVAWCEERDVKVVFMPSTLMKHTHYLENTKERWFYEHIADLVRQKGWSYVGIPYEYMYEKEMYFDTNFHLIHSAREMRTRQMAEELQVSSEMGVFKF